MIIPLWDRSVNIEDVILRAPERLNRNLGLLNRSLRHDKISGRYWREYFVDTSINFVDTSINTAPAKRALYRATAPEAPARPRSAAPPSSSPRPSCGPPPERRTQARAA